MRPPWKIIGLAGLAGVTATGVIVARKRRANREYEPDELRERLHSRLAEASKTDEGAVAQADADAASSPRLRGPRRLCRGMSRSVMRLRSARKHAS